VAVWILASAAFFVYVSNFGNYEAYGAFAGPVILLLWLYLTNLALLFGAEVNAILDERKHGVSHAAETDSIARQREENRVSDEEEEQEAGTSSARGGDGAPAPAGRTTATRATAGRTATATAPDRRDGDDDGRDTHGLVQGGNKSTGRALLGLAAVALRERLRRRSS